MKNQKRRKNKQTPRLLSAELLPETMLLPPSYGGDIERTLCVGLRPTNSGGSNTNSSSKYQHEIIAVNMISKQLLDLIIEHLQTLQLKNQFVVLLMLINPLQIEEQPEVPKLQLLKEIRYYEISY